MINKFNKEYQIENEVDFRELISLVKNNKYLLFIVSFVFCLIGFFYSYFGKPTFKGEFQIVLQDSDSSSPLNNIASTLFGGSDFNLKGVLSSQTKGKAIDTEIAILQSPSILKPVYDFVLESKLKEGEDWSELTFKEWANSFLEIKLLNDTSVLNISYIDQNKKFILETLDLISFKYQEYSRRDRIRGLNNAIDYLENSFVAATKKSKNSTEKLQKFALDNRLGNYDGLPLKNNFNSNEESLQNKNNISTPYNTTGRYISHFEKLQELESDYDSLSALLRPNSTILKEIKLQIDSLNSKLERPNEIIIEFRELLRNAVNDEAVLQNIDLQLRALNLEKAKQSNPWELISQPTIRSKPVTLSLKRSTAYGFGIGLISSFILIFLKDILILQKIYTKNKFQNLLPYPLLKTININDEKDENETVEILFKNAIKSEDDKPLGILILSDSKYEKANTFISKFKNYSKRNFIATYNIVDLIDYSDVILITYSGSISVKNLESIFEKINLSNLNIKGWLYTST